MKVRDNIVIRDTLLFNERIFSVIGLWPMRHRNVRFTIWMTYLGLHMITQYWDLIDLFGDFEMVVLNIMETALTTAVYIDLFLVRYNTQFKGIITAMKRDIVEKPFFENYEEKRLYSVYNNVAHLFGKYAVRMAMSTVYMMYFRPLIPMFLSAPGNKTIVYELPFRTHMVVDYTKDIRIFIFLYLYQLPFTYGALYHVSQIAFIGNFVLHLCGKLSVLSYRIRNIETASSHDFKKGIKKIAIMHMELVKLSEAINLSYYLILLIELGSCCIRLGLAIYIILIKLGSDTMAACNFMLYSVVQLVWLYLYCYIGEQLVYESNEMGGAFYEVDWPSVGNNDRKALIICMINGQKTMRIAAGKFYILSLFGFTSIAKTSMAFVSMLQANM